MPNQLATISLLALPLGFILLFSFLLGSVPWGVIISRLFYKTDIRAHGSGNIGTTNALRTLGKVGGGAVFALDFLKGLLAGYVAWSIGATLNTTDLSLAGSSDLQGSALALALLACVMGHIFSPWLRFKGGKGIAVAIGCLFFTFGVLGALLELAVFILLVVATRYVSLGSIASGIACLPITLWLYWGNPLAIALCWATGLVIIWAHRANITRLRAGTEHRIGAAKQEET